jgi:hypothetical protein
MQLLQFPVAGNCFEHAENCPQDGRELSPDLSDHMDIDHWHDTTIWQINSVFVILSTLCFKSTEITSNLS